MLLRHQSVKPHKDTRLSVYECILQSNSVLLLASTRCNALPELDNRERLLGGSYVKLRPMFRRHWWRGRLGRASR